MRFSGLTMSIAVTFVLVLCGSLALGLFVTVVFWQRSLLQAEEQRVLLVAQHIQMLLGADSRQGTTVDVEQLRLFVDDGGYALHGLSYYNGQTVISYPATEATIAAGQIARSSELSQQEITTYRGSIWAALSPGEKTLIVACPVHLLNGANGALAAIVELAPIYDKFRSEVRLVGAYVVINIIIFSVIGLYRMIGMVIKPIERMARMSEAYPVSGGLLFGGDDSGSEFGRLSMALNSMLLRIELDRDELRRTVASLGEANDELRRTQREMVHAEKFAAVGRLSAGLAHEIGNPLGIVQGYVELLRQPDLSSDDRRQFAQRALGELNRIDRLIRRLLDFARTAPRRHELFELQPVLDEIKDMFAGQARRDGIELVIDAAKALTVRGDRDGLKQVLLNCLLNSFDAIEAAGVSGATGAASVSVSVAAYDTESGVRWLHIVIEDTGIGLEHVDTSLLFEPFYTTKEPGKGTGLGLSVSHAIVEAHGGRMRIEGAKPRGATVIIELPVEKDG